MTNDHVIVGSSTHESQERETIMFCSQQYINMYIWNLKQKRPY